jgi:hypothetical protein
MDLLHVIIAMMGDRIVRVQCKTCRGDHAFKAPKGVKDPTAPQPEATRRILNGEKSAPRPAKVGVEEEWTRLMRESRDRPMREYSADQKFAVGDRLKHATFGEGVVTKLLYPNKAEICFQMDLKVLVHGLAN